MLKKNVFLFCIMLTGIAAQSQDSYTNTILKYRSNYKNDLYAIIQKDTAFVKFYPVDPAYRVTATIQKLSKQSFFTMPTTGGKAQTAIKYALVKFKLHGKDYSLFAYQLSFLLNTKDHKNDFFIPFTDSTSGIDSYGGGRYIDFVAGEIRADNILVIDFNKCYNPYCAFKSGYNCPIPPKENDLQIAIPAGEMNFGKKKH